jgi:HAD superfamily hydrolase (TIGR01490 family)
VLSSSTAAATTAATTVMYPYLVFSDVDETLSTGKSMLGFLRFRLATQYGRDGERRYHLACETLGDAAKAGAAREELNRLYYRFFAGEQVEAIEALGAAWFAESSAEAGFFIRSTADALARHRAAGAGIVLVSGSFAPCVDPIARRLGAVRTLCTELVVRSGRYTGEVAEARIGEGKRRAVQGVLAAHPEVGALDCFAFGDHPSDIAMLDCVGHPVAVGDDPDLLAYVAGRQQQDQGQDQD